VVDMTQAHLVQMVVLAVLVAVVRLKMVPLA
jgi:hypothetical protein